MNIELKNYIETELANNVSKEDLYTGLLHVGWNKEDVDEVFSGLESNTVPLPPHVSIEPTAVTEEGVIFDTEPKKSKYIFAATLLGVFVLAVSGLAAAYFFKVLPFSIGLPYSKDTLASGIAASLVNMKTFTYSMTGTFEVEERDADAKPFVVPITPETKAFKEKYTRDYERISAVSSILFTINNASVFPKSLTEVSTQANNFYYSSSQSTKITDPLTGVKYSYTATQDDFRLKVTFETINAINAIMDSYQFDAKTTLVDSENLTVTFTKESPTSVYLPSQLPKSNFEQLNEMMAYMPAELFFKASIEATSDFNKENAEWQVALDIEGDFGDLIYRIAGDVLRKDQDYYFRVRNIPSLFSSFITYEKGTWVKASAKWLEENNGQGMYSAPTFLIPDKEAEAEYKQVRTELSQFGVTVVKIADEEGVLLVKNEPKKEMKDGKELYRYDLTFNKDNLVQFVKRVNAEAQNHEAIRESELANDTTLLTYLESAEFDMVFEYYINNTSLSLYVNEEGFIELAEYSIRIVPDDEVKTLTEKQARLTLSVGFDNINKPVEIDAPKEYKDIEDMMEQMGIDTGFGSYSALGADASIKQSLSQLRTTAELVYNDTKYSYASVCEDEDVVSVFDSIEETLLESTAVLDTSAKVNCFSDDKWYVIASPLISDDTSIFNYWCVDSTGYSGGISEPLIATAESCSF